MDRILFGDNQFFAVNHMSEEKARSQAMRFRDINEIIKVIDYVYDIGINTFMCTTHDKISHICDHIRSNKEKYVNFKFYPCMPYAHKYANAVTDFGIAGALKKFMPKSNVIGSVFKGGVAVVKKDFISIMELLVDAEMQMFHGLNTEVIFLQNIVTDLILGLEMFDFFKAFSDYVQKKYNAEAGFITMNLPLMLDALDTCGINNPIVCSSINKTGFRMCGGIDKYEQIIEERNFRPIAMQVLAAGAIPPEKAIQYICEQSKIESILYGASTLPHIKQTKNLIDEMSLKI